MFVGDVWSVECRCGVQSPFYPKTWLASSALRHQHFMQEAAVACPKAGRFVVLRPPWSRLVYEGPCPNAAGLRLADATDPRAIPTTVEWRDSVLS